MVCVDCHGNNGCSDLLLHGLTVVENKESRTRELKVLSRRISHGLIQVRYG